MLTALQRVTDLAPMDQVFGMVQLHTRKPLERARGDVIVIAYPQKGGIRLESAKNGIVNEIHRHSLSHEAGDET
jgi:hypothetical protein